MLRKRINLKALRIILLIHLGVSFLLLFINDMGRFLERGGIALLLFVIGLIGFYLIMRLQIALKNYKQVGSFGLMVGAILSILLLSSMYFYITGSDYSYLIFQIVLNGILQANIKIFEKLADLKTTIIG